jgi:hypothetical protein
MKGVILRTFDSSSRLAVLLAGVIAVAIFLFAACGGDESGGDESGGESPPEEETATEGGGASGQKHPDVLEAELESSGQTYSLDVTVSSPYDSPERYADGWRVLAPDGAVLGEHELMHDHAGEQPFTRTQTGLEIPDNVEEITVEGRDLENGYGGETVTIPVERG